MTTAEGRATIKKGWERAGIAGIVENMTDFPDEDPLSNICNSLCSFSDNKNVRSILSDFVLLLNIYLIFRKTANFNSR